MTDRPAVSCRLVTGAADLAEHQRIRQAVFVDEQAIFAGSDADVRDAELATLSVLGCVAGVPAGAVRLFPLDDEGALWQGDRLAVLPHYRASGIGAPLVRFAVATAAEFGGKRMIAHIQLANERFFTRLGWTRRGGPEDYLGHPHLLMDIELAGYRRSRTSARPFGQPVAGQPAPIG